MKSGFLNDYFTAVAVKRLSAVEANPDISNQHEYNGVTGLKRMFGTEVQRKAIRTVFLYLSDEDDSPEAQGELTWYDARYNHPTRTEWRLYYPTNEVTASASAGDSLFICLRPDNTILQITAEAGSVVESQLFWLFGVRPDESGRFVSATDFSDSQADGAVFAARSILSKIGVELPYETEDFTDLLIQKFGHEFPTTREFSAFARSTVRDADPIGHPDTTLLAWYDREEALFKSMERLVIYDRLMQGFMKGNEVDVEAFIKYSLSVNNRRKSRAGQGFENHLEALFQANGVHYSHTPVTENKSKPDFIFPSIEAYRERGYDPQWLTMLGAKTTAKDRWRQVLEEADRIPNKHLITLEGAISTNQTDEMRSRNLQLVVPEPIIPSFTPRQQGWIWSVQRFLDEVKEKQIHRDEWIIRRDEWNKKYARKI